ncbi:MAG: hypothetical protein AABY22_34485, partial [Nanoarchaeota archaeon]
AEELGEPYDYRVDIDFTFKFFFNPISWLTFHIFFDELNGYGIRIGPAMVKIDIHKLIRFE